jgi:F-box-like
VDTAVICLIIQKVYTYLANLIFFKLLYEIFSYLSFKEVLNCSLICQRWAGLVKKDISFMRRFKLNIKDDDLRTTHRFTRKYINVRFDNARFFLPDSNLRQLVQEAHNIEFYKCTLPDMVTLRMITSWCQNLLTVRFNQLEFGELELTPLQQFQNPSNTSCEHIICHVNNTTWKVLECFESIGKLCVEYSIITHVGANYSLDLMSIVERYGPALKDLTLEGNLDSYERPLCYLRDSTTIKLGVLQLFPASVEPSISVSTIIRSILEKQKHFLLVLGVMHKHIHMPIDDVTSDTWVVANMSNLVMLHCCLNSAAGPLLNNLQRLRGLSLELLDPT